MTWWAVVVAQLVERLLPTPEVRGSNLVICELLFIFNCIEQTKIKKKRPGMAYFFLKKNKDYVPTYISRRLQTIFTRLNNASIRLVNVYMRPNNV